MIEANIVQKSLTNLCDDESLVRRKASTSKPYSQMLQESLSSAVSQLEKEIQGKLRQLLSNQKQQLSEVEERINSLTQELEKVILEFHTIARVTNKTYRSLQFLVEQSNKITDFNYQSTVLEELNIPNLIVTNCSRVPVVEKHDSGYILKERKVDFSNKLN